MIRALIVDDEELSRRLLKQLLIKYFHDDIEIIGTAESAEQARGLVKQYTPDVVFLDVEMPGEDGFEFLRTLPEKNFSVIFVTAFDQYAMRALKASAVDYILKPVDVNDLQNAVKKLLATRPKSQASTDNYQTKLSAVLENTAQPTQKLRKLAVPSRDKVLLVDVNDIIYFQADDNYAQMFLTNGEKLVVSKSLKECEELFSESDFVRIHKSFLVNLKYVKAYIRSDVGGGSVLLVNDRTIEVSRRMRATFLKRMHDYTGEP